MYSYVLFFYTKVEYVTVRAYETSQWHVTKYFLPGMSVTTLILVKSIASKTAVASIYSKSVVWRNPKGGKIINLWNKHEDILTRLNK